jgi:hypothetical protein
MHPLVGAGTVSIVSSVLHAVIAHVVPQWSLKVRTLRIVFDDLRLHEARLALFEGIRLVSGRG